MTDLVNVSSEIQYMKTKKALAGLFGLFGSFTAFSFLAVFFPTAAAPFFFTESLALK